MKQETYSRRDLLKLASLATLPALAACTPEKTTEPAAPPAPPRKKGLCLTTKRENWHEILSSLDCEWFYTWASAKHPATPPDIEFVPMVFGRWNIRENAAKAREAARAAGHNTILGFNEPEHRKQGNLTVQEALDHWHLLMETGMRLGSPAAVHYDNEWMRDFMEGAEKRGHRIDFTCIHTYRGANVEAFIKYLHEVHGKYGKPIWITEFAVGDWEAASPELNRHKPERILSFMKELLPELEKLDIVERYAWFPALPSNSALGTSALFDAEGNLTPLGECYRDV